MTPSQGRTSITRVEITPGSVAMVLAAIAVSLSLAHVFVAARHILSWVVACTVAAALIELVVQWLDRWMQRTLALVLVLLTIGAIASVLVFGVLNDLDHEVREIKADAPAAARQLERSQSFGKIATEVHLQERVEAAVQRLSQPSSGLAGQAVSSVGTYLICIVLTILFLSWGPKLMRGALAQLGQQRAETWRRIGEGAFARSRTYAFLAISQSVVVGLIGWGVCKLIDLPAPTPLALALAAASLLPNLGIALGALPILLLTFGFDTNSRGVQLTLLFVGLQTLSSTVIQPRIVKKSKLYVGPAVVTIGALVGFELYGIGGALYATALVVFTVAAIDSADAELQELPVQELPSGDVEGADSTR